MKRFFRLLLTGRDNKTYEIGRVLLFLGVLCFLFLSVYDALTSHRFDPMGFSAGLAGLLFGGAGGIAVKAKTEPERRHDPS